MSLPFYDVSTEKEEQELDALIALLDGVETRAESTQTRKRVPLKRRLERKAA